jgi:nucleoside-diphosphate-sugar epimerase
MKKALLVGGAGFIGHHLALALKQDGFDVAVIDGLEVNNLISLQDTRSNFVNRTFYVKVLEERLSLLRQAGIPIYVEDARDYIRLSRVVNEYKPDVIYLLAAVAHASRANKDPYSTFDHSFRTLENTLDITRSLDNKPQLVFFSSSMVYGDFMTQSPNEETNCDPKNIYGSLKFGGEKLARAYSNVFDFPVTIVRPSALYGPRCISRRVLQVFIENALRGQDLVIKGDGQESLDFTYIDDLISGLKGLTLNEKSYGEIFNITRGKAQKLIDAAQIIKGEFPKVSVSFESRDALNPERGTLDISKAKSLLGYAPTHDLKEGLKKYVEWYKSSWQLEEISAFPAESNE